MYRIILSIYIWLLVVIIALVLTPLFVTIWISTVVFDKRLIILHHFSIMWGSALTKLVPGWKIKIIGKEKLDYKAKIIVANHQSQEDILLIYRLGVPFNWISKAEVFKIPIYGWLMYLNGDIKLRRTSKTSIKRMILDAEKALQQGSTIMIFPEGTRSKTDKLGNFKEGAFKIAQNTKVPIVPVVIYGTGNKLLYPNGLFKGKHQVIVKVLDKIPYEQFKDKETTAFASEVRALIEHELNVLKQSNND